QLHSDVDQGDGNIKYVLSGEGATSIFIIDENTGDIHATKRLDREEQAYYTLRAQAVDRLTNKPVEPESEFVIKIQDINDNEPKFLDGPYTAGVPEMSPVAFEKMDTLTLSAEEEEVMHQISGQSSLGFACPQDTFLIHATLRIGQVTATDADDPTYGNSARVVYSILQGQPYFSVEPKTGIIRTALPNMDREAKDQYLLVIQAKDMIGLMGGLSGTTSVTVTLSDVNDNPPRFPRSKELDFETKSSYNLRIEVTNKNNDTQYMNLGLFSDTTAVKIIVEDVDEPPIFNSPVNRMVVSEEAKIGTIIGTVAAHDPDASNSPIRYSIDRNTDLERYFNIDATTGVISTAKQLDREMNAVHNITLLAMESYNPTQVGKGIALITVLDVNDNAPMFAIEYETFLCEHAQPGEVIQTISAVDKDEPPSGHRFYFALTPETASNLNFTLRDNKDNTASILTKRSDFRRQEQSIYKLPILIVDSGTPSLSSTNTLTIRVCDCDTDGTAQSCNAEAYILPAGLSTGALIAILACVLTLLVLVLLIVTMRRRKKEPLIFDEERDIRENIVRYDDEGGGEEDTEAFDMAALRNLNVIRDTKTRRDVTPEIQFFSRPSFKSIPDNVIFREFIWERLKEADIDPCAPPYDSLQTYAFEGNGSVAESLSSLESLSTDSDQNYDYLSDWGPRFKKLADMYGNNSEDSIFS
ncbi:CADH7 protein, partial [Polypterus senegalus]